MICVFYGFRSTGMGVFHEVHFWSPCKILTFLVNSKILANTLF